jgi:glycosyltransferase involved in cell wall biosynthesis
MTIVGVFPISEIRTGGHKRYIELSRQLVERGHTVLHICRPMLAAALPGTAIPIIPDELSGYLLPRWWRYRRWVRRRASTIREAVARCGADAGSGNTADLVLTFGETNYPAARAAADLLGVPLVFALRSNFVDEFLQFGTFRQRIRGFRGVQKLFQRWWKQRLEAMVCRGADLIVFQTEYDRDNVAGRQPGVAARSVVIPNSLRVSWLPAERAAAVSIGAVPGPADDDGGASADRQQTDEPRDAAARREFIYVGHLNERKGTQYLLPAVAELVGRGVTTFHLRVVGYGTLEEWSRRYVAEHGIDRWVSFLGRIEGPLDEIARADVLIVPSLYDSFPNTVLEALFVGTAVVGADAAGIATMLQDGELLFPRGSTTAVADFLAPIITDPARYQHIRELCARRRGDFDFDWAERWESAFRRLTIS